MDYYSASTGLLDTERMLKDKVLIDECLFDFKNNSDAHLTHALDIINDRVIRLSLISGISITKVREVITAEFGVYLTTQQLHHIVDEFNYSLSVYVLSNRLCFSPITSRVLLRSTIKGDARRLSGVVLKSREDIRLYGRRFSDKVLCELNQEFLRKGLPLLQFYG